MAVVRWTTQAKSCFYDTCDFFGRRSESYARTFASDVVRLVENLPAQPRLGSIVPEYELDEYRERYYQSFRIVYQIVGDEIIVVAFVNVNQRLPRTPPG